MTNSRNGNTTATKNGQVTIYSAIDELQRNFKMLNEKYFDGELEKPVITILTDVTSGAYGWITKNEVWSSKDKNGTGK